jgi:hypothetical protein
MFRRDINGSYPVERERWVPIIHPCWSRGMPVLVEGSSQGPVGPVLVIEVPELPERVKKMALVPDERAV